MRFFGSQRTDERLLWSRDSRFISRLARAVGKARVLELADSGWCLIAAAPALTDALAASVSDEIGAVPYGVVAVDPGLPESDRYVVALGSAVQLSGIADRIGMDQTPEIAQGKILDYFFTLRNNHRVAFQPIVDLATMEVDEYECLFRPQMPMLPQTISDIVASALIARRPVDLDVYLVERTLARIAELGPALASGPRRFSINLLPASLLAPVFDASTFADQVRAAGLAPQQLTVECTEQQSVDDVGPLKRQVRALRRLGFGFAVDDAGAGYASFTLIAALEPSIIKIDSHIVAGVGNKNGDAKKALVEAFVSFSDKIGARLVAEGIETRRDLAALRERGVELGQGYLLGRPAFEPRPARRVGPGGGSGSQAADPESAFVGWRSRDQARPQQFVEIQARMAAIGSSARDQGSIR